MRFQENTGVRKEERESASVFEEATKQKRQKEKTEEQQKTNLCVCVCGGGGGGGGVWVRERELLISEYSRLCNLHPGLMISVRVGSKTVL